MSVTEVFGSLASMANAARADAAFADRWHRSSCQNRDGNGVSGLPSPEARESPIDTTRRSFTVTRSSVKGADTRPEASVTVNVSAWVPCVGRLHVNSQGDARSEGWQSPCPSATLSAYVK